MARKSRQTILKRQREVRKAEKSALKRQKREERRHRDTADEQLEDTGLGVSENADSSGEGAAGVRGDELWQPESNEPRTP